MYPSTYAQTEYIDIRGKVLDSISHLPISNATVNVKGSDIRTNTDAMGVFELKGGSVGDSIVISFVGYKPQIIKVEGRNRISIYLSPLNNTVEEVTVVAYGTQKKTSLVASITSINPKELKGPTSNLTSMLAGKVAGVIAYQRSGEPGNDNASFFIRGVGSFGAGKKDPLILIDGIESSTNDLARLQPDDISGFSVLKVMLELLKTLIFIKVYYLL